MCFGNVSTRVSEFGYVLKSRLILTLTIIYFCSVARADLSKRGVTDDNICDNTFGSCKVAVEDGVCVCTCVWRGEHKANAFFFCEDSSDYYIKTNAATRHSRYMPNKQPSRSLEQFRREAENCVMQKINRIYVPPHTHDSAPTSHKPEYGSASHQALASLPLQPCCINRLFRTRTRVEHGHDILRLE